MRGWSRILWRQTDCRRCWLAVGCGLVQRRLRRRTLSSLGDEVDLGHAELAVDTLALDHHVDRRDEQITDIGAVEAAPAFGFLHEQGQLLEGQRAAVGMYRRDRAGMAG